ncbi:unnamed protein product [Linum trigynum]|uniref:Uncharacterized protein n=1 Tax=Linum trigynum TaxID=586398 RepID=A0AAV2FH56_9ROSI
MKVFSGGRQFARLLKSSVLLNSAAGCRNFSSESRILAAPQAACLPWLHQLHDTTFSSIRFPGHYTAKAHFSTESNNAEIAPTEAVKEFHEKILESVNTKRTMSPNAWLWSLIEKCESHKDIELLFDCLENIRRFRLSNLRIHDNFNCNLCREIAKACARAGAIDFGKKTLWKHNVYGLTPSVASANHLLKYAKVHNDVKLMVEIMGLLKKNDVPLQPSTADIVFSICNNVGNLELMAKYFKKFVKAGVQLRTAAFDASMDLAAKKGDTEALWDVEKLRSKSMKQLSLVTGFSCAKGLILGRKPQEAASIIQVLNETLPETKKSGIMVELQKLASEWPLDVVKHQPEDKRKELAAALKSDIPAMISALLNTGLEVSVDLENLTSKEEMLQ